MIRKTLEVLLKDKTRKRYLPDNVGGLPIYASTAGGLRQLFYPMSSVDPDLFQTAISIISPGDVVWDIGANVGLFSVAARGLVGPNGKVFSFEPDTKLIDLLRKNSILKATNAGEMNVIPAGVAGKTGVRTFNIAKRARASNSLQGYGNTQTGGVRISQSIICLSIDDCLYEISKPDVVKIDVEGAEQELLENSTQLLSVVRPRIAVEVSVPTRAAITELLKDNSYKLFDANSPFKKDLEIERAAWNTIGIPVEQMDLVFRE